MRPFTFSSASLWSSYLSHNGDGGLSFCLGHPVLDQVVHVLVVQQADQVEGTETGGAPQGQVSDHHRAEEGGGSEMRLGPLFYLSLMEEEEEEKEDGGVDGGAATRKPTHLCLSLTHITYGLLPSGSGHSQSPASL